MSTDRVRVPRQRIVKLGGYNPKAAKRSPASTRPATPTVEAGDLKPKPASAPEKESTEYLQHLVRRLFYPNVKCASYQDVLPTLTSSISVDIQLYALIGLLFRSFITKWYKNITDDTEFTAELVAVVAHITRELESRMSQIDVMELLLDDIPFLLDQHLMAYRRVLKELGSSLLPFDTIDTGFDHVSGHKAFTKNDQDKEVYLKLLANNVLEKLLPPDEQNSELVNKFVGALVGDMLLKIITNKISQPYQVFEIMTLVCKLLVGDDEKKETEKNETVGEPTEEKSLNTRITSTISNISHFIADTTSTKISKSKTPPKKIAKLHIFSFINNIFLIGTHRPVLYAAIKSMNPFLRHDRVDHILSNLLQNKMVSNIRSEALFVTIVKAGRNNLFPTDEDMGPPRIEPDLKEFEQIRQTTKNYLIKVCKKFNAVSYLLLATKDEELDDVIDDFLTSFEHPRVNEHLVFKLIDLLIMKLFPELGENGSRNE